MIEKPIPKIRPIAQVPTDYREYLQTNLNLFERMSQVFSTLDKRQDYTPIILTQIKEGQDIGNKELLDQIINLAKINSLLVTAIANLTTALSNLKLSFENPESIATHQKLVPTAGTAVQLPPVKIPYDREVVILALSANTGTIYIGTSKLNAEDHTISFPLLAGESIEYKIRDLSLLWVDASVSTEGIIWTVEQNG